MRLCRTLPAAVASAVALLSCIGTDATRTVPGTLTDLPRHVERLLEEPSSSQGAILLVQVEGDDAFVELRALPDHVAVRLHVGPAERDAVVDALAAVGCASGSTPADLPGDVEACDVARSSDLVRKTTETLLIRAFDVHKSTPLAFSTEGVR